MYHITVASKDVFIVTYGCHSTDTIAPVLSHEHKEVGLFTEAEVPDYEYARRLQAQHRRVVRSASQWRPRNGR